MHNAAAHAGEQSVDKSISLFGSGVDVPPGRFALIPSRITGQILRYFTPDPLTELIRRCESSTGEVQTSRTDEAWLSLPFLRAACARAGRLDPAQASAMLSTILHGTGALASAAVWRLPETLRTDIVFSGAPVASAAHVFADPACIHYQLEDLADALGSETRMPIPAFAACVGFHAMHLHPFEDGNGRWTRLLVVETSTDRGASFSGLAHAVLLNQAKPQLVRRHWPRAREDGLREYFERCMAFDAAMRGAASHHGVTLVNFCAQLTRLIRSSRAYRDVLVGLCLGGALSADSLRSTAGVSRRVADGWLEQLRELCPQGLEIVDQAVSLAPLLEEAERAALLAITNHFGEPNE